jgi:hypothetical protein
MNLPSLEEFHQDFLQTILSDSQSREISKAESFFEKVCEQLISSADLTKNYANANYYKKGIRVDGFDYDEERKILSLLVSQFFQTEEKIETLTNKHIDDKFKQLKTFYQKCIEEGFYHEMEETAESYDMAYQICQKSKERAIEKVKLVILTDGKATRNLKELPDNILHNTPIEFRVIDISYLYKIYLSQNESGVFEVETDFPCLAVSTTSDEYQSYLSVISGNELVRIYDNFGQKLFEQNVRTFLQFRGSVNKGLRNTIEYNPTMFFAYNNGITATATRVDLKDNRIKKIHNLQIVNGGQTTSAIYAAFKNLKQDVSDISVQIKLSVMKKPEEHHDFVSKVSEYANTQNKINKSDFFSNSPFHKEFKEYSKRVWVPTIDGSQHRTKWFYERVRGEYLNEQAYLTPSEKRQFQLECPKKQVLDKTFLSKSENTWEQKPHIVSKGAQYSFAEYAKTTTEKCEKNSLTITENYFRDSICRVILFKNVERMISNADWYNGGFRAQIVTYSIAYLAYLINQNNKFLNFKLIWEEQSIPPKLEINLEQITKLIHEKIISPPPGSANIAQWCKQEGCWNEIKKIEFNVDLDDLLIEQEEYESLKKESKKEKKLDSGIEIQTFIVQLPSDKKNKLLEYYKKNENLSSKDSDILTKWCENKLKLPSEKQSKILYSLYQTAISDGLPL